MTAHLITEALTITECRIVIRDLLAALERFDEIPHTGRLVDDLQGAAALAERFAGGVGA